MTNQRSDENNGKDRCQFNVLRPTLYVLWSSSFKDTRFFVKYKFDDWLISESQEIRLGFPETARFFKNLAERGEGVILVPHRSGVLQRTLAT